MGGFPGITWLKQHPISRTLELTGAVTLFFATVSFAQRMSFAQDMYTKIIGAPSELHEYSTRIGKIFAVISNGVELYRLVAYAIFSYLPVHPPFIVVDIFSAWLGAWCVFYFYAQALDRRLQGEDTLNKEIMLRRIEQTAAEVPGFDGDYLRRFNSYSSWQRKLHSLRILFVYRAMLRDGFFKNFESSMQTASKSQLEAVYLLSAGLMAFRNRNFQATHRHGAYSALIVLFASTGVFLTTFEIDIIYVHWTWL